jgi:hypothetical protein
MPVKMALPNENQDARRLLGSVSVEVIPITRQDVQS